MCHATSCAEIRLEGEGVDGAGDADSSRGQVFFLSAAPFLFISRCTAKDDRTVQCRPTSRRRCRRHFALPVQRCVSASASASAVRPVQSAPTEGLTVRASPTPLCIFAPDRTSSQQPRHLHRRLPFTCISPSTTSKHSRASYEVPRSYGSQLESSWTAIGGFLQLAARSLHRVIQSSRLLTLKRFIYF